MGSTVSCMQAASAGVEDDRVTSGLHCSSSGRDAKVQPCCVGSHLREGSDYPNSASRPEGLRHYHVFGAAVSAVRWH